MAHTLTEREHRRIERMALKGDVHRIFSFFADLHSAVNIKRPLLLGSVGDEAVLIQGYYPDRQVLEKLRLLSPKFNQFALGKRVLRIEKRSR